jgi:hypothetical protein
VPLSKPRGLASSNAPNFGYQQNDVYYRPGSVTAQAAARKLATVIGSSHVGSVPGWLAPRSKAAMATIIVGRAFTGLLPPPPKPPRPLRPHVTFEPNETLSLLRPLQPRAGFQLMTPTIVESGSSPDSSQPARLYLIDGYQKAVRLVYHDDLTYWGIGSAVNVEPDTAERVDDFSEAEEVDRDQIVDREPRQRLHGGDGPLRPALRVAALIRSTRVGMPGQIRFVTRSRGGDSSEIARA